MKRRSKVAAGGLVLVLAAAILTTFVVMSRSRPSSHPKATGSPCFVPRVSGPGFDASINNPHDGTRVCITVGERLLVELSSGSRTSAPWQAIHTTRPGILRVVPLTLMFPRGMEGTNVQGVRVGSVDLTALRPVCLRMPSRGAACTAVVLWQITVVVQASPAATKKPSGTGVFGSVLAGPTCPVERVGQPCPPEPVIATVFAQGLDGKTVAATDTSENGHYALTLEPGTYRVLVIKTSPFPRCPIAAVTVPSGTAVHVDINCDTGIR